MTRDELLSNLTSEIKEWPHYLDRWDTFPSLPIGYSWINTKKLVYIVNIHNPRKIITQNDWMMQRSISNNKLKNKKTEYPWYQKEIKPGVRVDIYDVLKAFEVTNPAAQHAIKKMLMPGVRHGSKDTQTDYDEAIASLKRAKELE